MGIYDTYGDFGMQIKVGHVEMRSYKIGDKVPLHDGIFVAHEGAVVVKDGIFIAEFRSLWSKWGDCINTEFLIERMNPLAIELEKLKGE